MMLMRPFGDRGLGALAKSASCSRCGLASQGIAMKPAAFGYQAPGTLREAIDLLASNPEAVLIAGGQSLMPVLAFRPWRPRACWSICGGYPGSAISPSAM